ncbi:hypothetical protein AL035_15300 [Salipiger aestuarii]|nr:hypothetical protein AL035_15300 [Salipiger aestuarii]
MERVFMARAGGRKRTFGPSLRGGAGKIQGYWRRPAHVGDRRGKSSFPKTPGAGRRPLTSRAPDFYVHGLYNAQSSVLERHCKINKGPRSQSINKAASALTGPVRIRR